MKDCPRCIHLTRELREARELIAEYERPAGTIDADVYRINDWLGRPCQVQSAKMLAMLLEKPGEIVLRDRLVFGMDYGGDLPDSKILQVNASRIRRALRNVGLHVAIKSAYAKGYYIEKSDAALIRRAMEEAGI